MEPQFWQNLWREGRTAFHEGAPNQLLLQTLGALSLRPRARVFVPLCGKTNDLDWFLSQGHRVSGIELNEGAVRAVFERLRTEPEVTTSGDLTQFVTPGLTLWCGDLFKLTAENLGPIDLVYDRAALVAMPPDMRGDYTRQLRTLSQPSPMLVVAYDFGRGYTDGPPFSVPEETIRTLYADAYAVRMLGERPLGGPLSSRASSIEQAWHLRPLG